MTGQTVTITSQAYWFKVVDFLQTNWALVDSTDSGTVVYFIGDTSGVFDRLTFESEGLAEGALRLNGFRRFQDDPQAAGVLRPPSPPFQQRPHPNGPIYSSGRFWRS